MINVQKLRKWEFDDNDASYHMIAVGYDPEMKEIYKKNRGFDLECTISDKEKFADILNFVIKKYIGENFLASLKNPKFSWYPKWLENEYSGVANIKEYLENINWKKRKYFGEFLVKDIKKFLIIFLDYPSKYRYQDIELYSIDSNYVLVVSNHGNFWIITDDKKNLSKIAKILDRKGATVFPLKFLK